MSADIITCTNCKRTFNTEDAQVICSNCFVCKGCERYYCPYCNAVVIIDPIKPMFEENKK